VKLFGHHLTRLFVALAVLDAALFFGGLYVLSHAPACEGCLPGSAFRLRLHQMVLLTLAFTLITTSVGLYNNDSSRDLRVFVRRFLLTWQFLLIPLLIVLFVNGGASGLSLTGALGTFFLTLAGFMGVLFVVHLGLVWCFGLPFMKKRLVVLGAGPGAAAIVDFLEGPGRTHFRHLTTIAAWRPSGGERLGNLLLKAPEQAPTPLTIVAETLHVDEIVIAVDERRGLPVSELLDCKLMGVEVIDALTFWEREAGQIDPTRVGAGWLAFSDGFALDRRHRFVKRLLDVAISLAFLIAVAPLMLITALSIKLESPGPVFYRQERVGLNGKTFRLWKFRSMRNDAEGDGVPRWAKSTDDRVTRVGRFIRKARIDEIPQVINVLAGEMSFIGPRPERPFFVDQLRQQIPHYDLRHRVRPGITGWAQVNYPYGASVEDAIHKLSYDLYYLKKNDLLLDLAIMMQTVRVVLFAVGGR
jgi:sugar transferase (PEP-CTERM system associated)